ncbi:MAG: hypothetical protein ABR910_12265 [Acidobacteriaceae bacterium]
MKGLIRNTGICAECEREQKGQTIMDNHHVAGRANSPATVPIPANDHRDVLSETQRNWPKATLENREGCPLLVAAASIRGLIDTLDYLTEKFVRWIPEMLEALSTMLAERLGRRWWLNTPLARFARKEKNKCRKSRRYR